MSVKDFDWKKYLNECLSSTQYCALGTVDEKGVWVNPVYFAWDDKFNLYFISQMSSRHMQNIQKDPRVSIAIYNATRSKKRRDEIASDYKTEQKGDVCGTYVEGEANIIRDDQKEIQKAFD